MSAAGVPDGGQAKRFVAVDGIDMAYVERGRGAPIVFVHGNPTSSHLWRNVIPHVEDLGRCIAPDLVGHGDSGKLAYSGPGRYTLAEHTRYFDGFLEAVGATDDVTFVVHDWGSALGFDWSRRHPRSVKGICYMEAIVTPLGWDDWPTPARGVFEGFRSPAGEEMVLQKNVFVERVLPAGDPPYLSEADMEIYRAPFARAGEDRRPTLTWPRQIPIDGEPPEVVEVVEAYQRWLATSPVPKLFVNADPGAILVGRQREVCRSWPNQTEVTVPGGHFVQEFSPHEIGRALRDWLSASVRI